MTEQEFDDGLWAWLHHEPFQPVVIEMTNDQRLLIDTRRVFLGKGSAVFMTPRNTFISWTPSRSSESPGVGESGVDSMTDHGVSR